jgi:hypothetical protein
MESTTKELVGQSGRHYHIERVLQEKEFPNGISPLRVYIASCVPVKVNSIQLLTQAHPSAENQKFVLKNLFSEDRFLHGRIMLASTQISKTSLVG